jgi:hypothetical protein
MDSAIRGSLQTGNSRDRGCYCCRLTPARLTICFNWGCSSSAERSFDMREVKRAARFIPTISEGIAARADASHASDWRCKSFCPHQFQSLWCSQPTCLPLMQEITGAKPVRDVIFIGAWLTGNSRPTWLRTRQPWTCKSSRADHLRCPQSIVSDALARYASFSPVQLRVGAPFP